MHVHKALTIAGSDSGGGAGIQADLKTFQELSVFGMSALTAITAQNTLGVSGIFPLSVEAVAAQIDAVAGDLAPDAVKTGMLFDRDIIACVREKARHYGWEKLVVDPVMIAKGGAPLLIAEGIDAVKTLLLPVTYMLTPNILEAEVLTGLSLTTIEARKEAARMLSSFGCRYVLLKGGHDDCNEYSTDLLFDGTSFTEYVGKRVHTQHTHGTGCTFSAAITAELAWGKTPWAAVDTAKQFIQAAIEQPLGIGAGHGPTNHWAYRGGVRC
ncbi:UNVERIFIED_CONTAM: hydroxymethylpyrimidine/phosphomethylpyrimidine kinase [Brevibacillus sp. OAP136]